MPIETVDEAIALLTGVPAGEANAAGEYPPGTRQPPGGGADGRAVRDPPAAVPARQGGGETMNRHRQPSAIRSILVALDDACSDHETMETAAHLAADLHAELQGLYIEDVDLLRMAALPFTEEITTASGMARPIDAQSMERAMQQQGGTGSPHHGTHGGQRADPVLLLRRPRPRAPSVPCWPPARPTWCCSDPAATPLRCAPRSAYAPDPPCGRSWSSVDADVRRALRLLDTAAAIGRATGARGTDRADLRRPTREASNNWPAGCASALARMRPGRARAAPPRSDDVDGLIQSAPRRIAPRWCW